MCDHGDNVQNQDGNLFGKVGVIDVHADEKGQGLSNEYEVGNYLGGDRSATECVYFLVFSYHFWNSFVHLLLQTGSF